ncbi:hypothetical protein Tco_0906770 [Tanacetum coccineum]|uniref:Uncharacterized protein n=1 Tax=Tanacetum coccineum TaxID=301880 RepID=A0ABQ5CHR1_9ASTR
MFSKTLTSQFLLRRSRGERVTEGRRLQKSNVALELGKSIIITEAEEEEAARQVHATHARIVTEFVPKPVKKKTSSRSTRSVVIQDTPSAPKSKPTTSKPKLKGVPDESTVVSATSSEGTSTKPGVPDEEKVSTEEKVILEWGFEQESEYLEKELREKEEIDWIDSEEDDEKKDDTDDDKSINLEMTNDEETNDEVLQVKEQVNEDEDEEMLNAEVEYSRKGNAEISDVAKADAEKTEEAKDDSKKAELPPTSSSLSVYLSFGDQFLLLSSDTSLIGTVKDTIDEEISSLFDIKFQSEVPHIQSPYMLKVPVSIISQPSVLTPVQETTLAVHVTTLPPQSVSTIPPAPLQQTTPPIPSPPITIDALTITTVVPESDTLSAVQLRVAKLEKDVSELKKIDHSTKALATLKLQVPTVVEQYLGSKIGDDLQKTPTINLEQESEKSASKILKIKKEQADKQKMPKYTIKSTDKVALKELYHALMEALIEDENVIDKGVVDTVKDHKRKHDDNDDDDEDPPKTPKGKALSKGSKTGKSASAKESVEEPMAEVVMDDTGEDVVHDDEQPQDTSEPKTAKTPNLEWFKQPPRPLTLDPEWNKRQLVLDKLDWNNPEGDRYPFDLSKPLHLQGRLGHLTVAADYFFNNDLEYLKSSDPERMYTTSITKTKVARYKIVGIEDMVPTLWSTIKYAYDKDVTNGIKHWGERRKLWYRSQMNKFSKQNVYSTQKILSVKRVCVKKLHRYAHMEEVVVKRADRKLYKFKEGDFVDLHLNDIKDMLLLVQHKLFHLNESDIVDFIVALRMFTRSLVIKRRVEDLQLGVESYQKKLNITTPQQTFIEIKFKELYTPSYKPPRVFYEDLAKQKRVMRADELYKFTEGTLKKVRDELHHRIIDFRLGYNDEMSKRKGTAIDKKRSELIVLKLKVAKEQKEAKNEHGQHHHMVVTPGALVRDSSATTSKGNVKVKVQREFDDNRMEE